MERIARRSGISIWEKENLEFIDNRGGTNLIACNNFLMDDLHHGVVIVVNKMVERIDQKHSLTDDVF